MVGCVVRINHWAQFLALYHFPVTENSDGLLESATPSSRYPGMNQDNPADIVGCQPRYLPLHREGSMVHNMEVLLDCSLPLGGRAVGGSCGVCTRTHSCLCTFWSRSQASASTSCPAYSPNAESVTASEWGHRNRYRDRGMGVGAARWSIGRYPSTRRSAQAERAALVKEITEDVCAFSRSVDRDFSPAATCTRSRFVIG